MFAKQFRPTSHTLLVGLLVTSLLTVPAFAATETVVHFFGPADGQKPFAGLTEHAGAFYGTTTSGGQGGAGTVFAVKLVNGVWRERVLYSFAGGTDGADPRARVAFDRMGNL